jgi:hypothetical protein
MVFPFPRSENLDVAKKISLRLIPCAVAMSSLWGCVIATFFPSAMCSDADMFQSIGVFQIRAWIAGALLPATILSLKMILKPATDEIKPQKNLLVDASLGCSNVGWQPTGLRLD